MYFPLKSLMHRFFYTVVTPIYSIFDIRSDWYDVLTNIHSIRCIDIFICWNIEYFFLESNNLARKVSDKLYEKYSSQTTNFLRLIRERYLILKFCGKYSILKKHRCFHTIYRCWDAIFLMEYKYRCIFKWTPLVYLY